jgi:hypothetical protein
MHHDQDLRLGDRRCPHGLARYAQLRILLLQVGHESIAQLRGQGSYAIGPVHDLDGQRVGLLDAAALCGQIHGESAAHTLWLGDHRELDDIAGLELDLVRPE